MQGDNYKIRVDPLISERLQSDLRRLARLDRRCGQVGDSAGVAVSARLWICSRAKSTHPSQHHRTHAAHTPERPSAKHQCTSQVLDSGDITAASQRAGERATERSSVVFTSIPHSLNHSTQPHHHTATKSSLHPSLATRCDTPSFTVDPTIAISSARIGPKGNAAAMSIEEEEGQYLLPPSFARPPDQHVPHTPQLAH